jgi:hypothetical protein
MAKLSIVMGHCIVLAGYDRDARYAAVCLSPLQASRLKNIMTLLQNLLGREHDFCTYLHHERAQSCSLNI